MPNPIIMMTTFLMIAVRQYSIWYS